MIIAGIYSFKGGKEFIETKFAVELAETKQIIAAVDGSTYKIGINQKNAALEQVLYDPASLSRAFSIEFEARHWQKGKIRCEYPTEYYVHGYVPATFPNDTYREIDFVKNRVGIGLQFSKYASSMVYNVCAKMTIFHNLDLIDVGIEIVPLKGFADDMSTGVSYFEQFVWDLEHRGVADIDIPVLILGIAM
ncbi:MAG: restriction endonuclease [Anaerolineae bacterium]|nr:restriction endonuclease [Anaerolineales bacterium]MCQ3971878.1 restriction endonuclease [Anaerolineae bacterium]